MYKLVLIDIDNTLLDFNKCAAKSMEAAAAELGLALPEDIFSVYKRVNNLLWMALERGEITREKLLAERWNAIFEEADMDFDGVLFEKYFGRYLYNSDVHVEGALDLIKYLSTKYIVCAASNGGQNQQVNRLTRAGMIHFVNGVYTSELIGIQKPAKAFFAGCLERASCFMADEEEPLWYKDTVMIGDSLTADIKGPSVLGIDTIWYDHDGMRDSVPDPGCPIAGSLSEIKELL